MNFKLSKEIYGQPWFIDALSWQRFAPMLKNNADFNIPNDAEKDNNHYLLNAAKVFDNKPFTDFSKLEKNEKYISVINFNGAITKGGGASHYGTIELGQTMVAADNMPNVIGHIFMFDSGGGSESAVTEMVDYIGQTSKPIVSFIDGMAASAAYYIASYSNYIISKRETNFIGSIGTMMEFSGYPKQAEDKNDGYRYIRLYASKSELKNNDYEEAINNWNMQPMLDKVLNPANERFISAVKNNRKNVNEAQLTGDIFTAAEVVGTLIDSIGNLQMAIDKVEELYSSNFKNKGNMTKEELKQAHPAVYNEILQEGAINERDRVEAILTYVDVDAKAAVEMVSAGTQPTQKFFAEMSRKAMAKDLVNEAQQNAPAPVETPKEVDAKKEGDIEMEALLQQTYAAVGIEYKPKQ